MRVSAFVLAVALALGGCTRLHWAKPGADDEAAREDLDGCRALARAHAARMADPGLSPTVDPRFGSITPQPRRVEQPLVEAELLEACMREKGYRLVPAER